MEQGKTLTLDHQGGSRRNWSFCNTGFASRESFSSQIQSNSWRTTHALGGKHKNGLHPFLNLDFVPLFQDGFNNNKNNKTFPGQAPALGPHPEVLGAARSHQLPSSVFRQRVRTLGFRPQLPTIQLVALIKVNPHLGPRFPICKIRLFRLISNVSSSSDIPPRVCGSAPVLGPRALDPIPGGVVSLVHARQLWSQNLGQD